MKTVWTKGLTGQALIEVKADYVGAHAIRKRLAAIMQDKADARRKASIAESSYDNSNWALKQADAIGYERAISELISLISDEK